jgi:membrane protease YdiL (CAAX protease family)
VEDEDPGGGPPIRWGLREAVATFLVAMVLSVLGAGIAQSAVNYHPLKGRPVPIAVTIGGLVGLWIGLGGGVIYAARTKGSGSVEADFGLRTRWRTDIVVGLVAGLGSQYGLVPLLYWPFERADPSLRRRLENQAKDVTRAAHGGLQITLLFLFLAIGAPLIEELFFRGLLLRSLRRSFGPAVAIVGSAVVFGLAHFELLQLPALIVFGLVLGVLAERTGRLGPGIVAHAAFNAATVISLTWAK